MVVLFVVNLILITVYMLVTECTVSIETNNFNFPLVCALSLVKLTYKSDGALYTENLADDRPENEQ